MTTTTPSSPLTPEQLTFDLALAYVEDRVSAEHRQQIEAMALIYPEVDAYLEEVFDAWLADPNLGDTIPQLHKQMTRSWTQTVQQKQQRQWMFQAAIALLIALGTGAALWWINGSQSSCGEASVQQMALEAGLYEQQYVMMGARRTATLEEAFAAYDQGQYAQVIPIFQQMLDTTQQNLATREMTICLAVSLLMNQQEAQALPYLQHARGFAEPKYRFAADWYESLIWLQQGEIAKAQPLLTSLSQQANPYQAAARKLLPCIE